MNPRASAAGAFLHPLPWLAVAVLAFNDHVGKGLGPGWLTGKLSDFAGLAFFPLLLDAMLEALLVAVGRYRGPSTARLSVCVVLTAVSFAFMKVTSLGGLVYARGLGAIRWPFEVALAWVAGHPSPPLLEAGIVRDPTDLVALLALFLVIPVHRARLRSHAPVEPGLG